MDVPSTGLSLSVLSNWGILAGFRGTSDSGTHGKLRTSPAMNPSVNVRAWLRTGLPIEFPSLPSSRLPIPECTWGLAPVHICLTYISQELKEGQKAPGAPGLTCDKHHLLTLSQEPGEVACFLLREVRTSTICSRSTVNKCRNAIHSWSESKPCSLFIPPQKALPSTGLGGPHKCVLNWAGSLLWPTSFLT
jgi:hypothetical protein